MNLGIFLMPLSPPGRTMGQVMDEVTRKALLLDRAGFGEFWLGEHFSATSEAIPSPLMFMASLLPQTENLTFGTGVISLPNRHPAVVGAEVAQFDQMAGGRFRFGIGTGSLPSDWELFQLSDEPTRKRMMLESLAMMQSIWRQGPPYEFNGEFWKFAIAKNVNHELQMGILPKPRSPEGPPIHVSTSTPNSSTALLAGERGWGPLSSALLTPAALATHWTQYARGLAAGGRPVDGTNWRVVRTVLVAPSDAEAERRLRHSASSVRFYFDYIRQVLLRAGKIAALKASPQMADSDVTAESVMMSRVIYGSPETVRDKLIALRDSVGPFGHLLVSGMDWSGPNEDWERESLTLLGTQVWPAVRRHYAVNDEIAVAAQ